MNADRKTVHVTPNEGRVVPDPDHGDNLPPEGRTVARSPYWARRIKDQDVTAGEPQAGDAGVTADEPQATDAAVATKTAKGAK